MITRMMPPAIESDPVEKWSSLANSSPRPMRMTAVTPAVMSILRTMSAFVSPSSAAVASTNGTSAIFGPIPMSRSRKVSITK